MVRPVRRLAAIAAILFTAVSSAALLARSGDDPKPAATPLGRWEPIGPAPITEGQIENVRNPAGEANNEVAGAVHTVASHPIFPQIIYIGTVNGGVWRTKKALSNPVTWERLTDDQPSQSIGALEFDPTDSTGNTLLAGLGRYSSFSRVQGGAQLGVLHTANGGSTWSLRDGGGVLINKNISGVAPRGKVFVVSVNTATPNDNDNRGVFRSTDAGATFERISRADLAFGLPAGVSFDLVGDKQNKNRLFVPVTSATGGPNGIYRSDNQGATWTKVSDAALDAFLAGGTAVTNVELAVGRHNNVYVAIARAPGRLAAVFRSGDAGATWTQMSLPITPSPIPQGVHPGAQSFIHMAIAADRKNPFIVYVSGDRQPDNREETGLPASQVPQFPNVIGARNYAGRVFRGDASKPPASQWSHMTNIPTSFMPDGGTANNSSPHADSREMIMDEVGDIIEVDDGGVYRRTKPQTNLGDWISLNGNLQVAEQHSTSYDSLAKVAFSGNQDTGSPHELGLDDPVWESLLTADGGRTIVDDFSSTTSSLRYNSFQNLGAFLRGQWSPANEFLGFTFIPMNPLGGVPRPTPQFYTPLALNRVQGNRILIGAANGLYESADRGDNVARIDLQAATGSLDTLVYGATNNPDAIYGTFGGGAGTTTVKVRLAPPPAPLVAGPSLGATVIGVAMHPDDANVAVAATVTGVFLTTNGGGAWTDVTGNLQTLVPNTLRSTEIVVTPSGTAVVIGSLNGAFVATQSSGFTSWQRLGTGLPRTPVYEIQHKAVDDLLVVGTLGRGAFKLKNISAVVGGL